MVLVMGASGCRDAEADRRAQVQRLIDQAAQELIAATHVAPSPGSEAFTAREQKLRSVLGTLSGGRAGAGTGAGGQQAAIQLLTASAAQELGTMHLAALESAASTQRRDLAQLEAMLASAMRLQTIAAAQEATARGPAGQTTAVDQHTAADGAREAGDALARVAEPIRRIESENAADQAEISRLESEAQQLARRAIEQGHAAGFQDLEQSVATRRSAEQARHEVDLRQLELRYMLQPERNLAENRAAYYQSLIAALGEAEEQLRDHAAQQDAQDRSIRDSVRELGGRLTQAVAELQRHDEEALKPRYEQAAQELDRAAAAATSAASQLDRDSAGSARLSAARIHQLLGRLHALRAETLAAQHGLLERLNSASKDWGAGAAVGGAIESVSAGREQAIGQARAALTAAQESLGQITMRGDAAELAAFRAGLGQTARVLAGEPVSPEASTRKASPPAPSRAATVDAAAGYVSPEEFVEMMNAGGHTGADAMAGMLNSIRATTPEARSMVSMWRTIMEPSRLLNEAMIERFGADAASMVKGMGGPDVAGAAMTGVAIVNQTETEAEVRGATPDGQVQTLRLVREGERWLVDGDQLVRDIDPAQLQMMQQFGSLLEGMARAMRDLAGRVRAGEFASPTEVMQQMMGSLMGDLEGMDGLMPPPEMPRK
jgi:hypothetical protein